MEKKFIDVTIGKERIPQKAGLIQYDYGQILRIHGLDLPPAVEIMFGVPTYVLEDSSSDENACASFMKICENTNAIFFYSMASPIETDLTPEEIEAFKALVTNYPVTNISVTSDQLDGYTVFNYPISLANGWNYVKQQLNDSRDYIYDMDLQSAEAYVNSEYAVALTELEV